MARCNRLSGGSSRHSVLPRYVSKIIYKLGGVNPTVKKRGEGVGGFVSINSH